ncbi:MAG: GGDEF domain-containing protein [Sulfurimonadaceae bacterium]|nr:GGDEF domain-containing protein [Sulfurimonadaceae bacterium]
MTDTQIDTATIKNLKRVGNNLQEISLKLDASDKKTLRDVDQLLEVINSEYMKNKSNQFDVGFNNVQVEFATLKRCWGAFKTELANNTNHAILRERNAGCQKTALKLIVLVDKMANIKRERALLRLNITLIFTMIIMVATIYFVRTSMKRELERHTIYDVETKLFNRDYFDAEVKKACALAVRKQHPLALIAIAIDNFDAAVGSLEKRKREEVIKMIGGLLIAMTRTSDTACRYEEDEFVIITPETALQDAILVSQRIHKRILEHDFHIQHPISVTISVSLQHENEEVGKLIKRTVTALHKAKKQGNTIVTADVK